VDPTATDAAASALAWALFALTPFSVLLFLTAFLVNMARGSHDTAFTRFCARAQLPAFGLVVACLLLTARYF
jgi:hypothetical protein